MSEENGTLKLNMIGNDTAKKRTSLLKKSQPLQPILKAETLDRPETPKRSTHILTPTTATNGNELLDSQGSPTRRSTRRGTCRTSNSLAAAKSPAVFDDKTKQASFEINRKMPSLRRRVATVEPINLADINSSSSAKKVLSLITETSRGLAKPNKSYRFQCEGILGAPEEEGCRKVEWNASFERPIEQLIYPSLQRFDHEAYTKRRNMQMQLHGHHGGGFALETSTDSVGVGLELLSAAEGGNLTEILPDWTAAVTDVPVAVDTALSLASASILRDIEVDGEEFLREKLRRTYAQVRATEQEAEAALSRLAASEALLSSLPSSIPRLSRRRVDRAPVLARRLAVCRCLMPYHTMPCHTILCHAILCHDIP